MKKVYFWMMLFFIIYLVGLFFLYYESPEKHLVDEGDVYFYSCAPYNCSKFLIDLFNDSVSSNCAFYDLGESALVNYLNNSNDVEVLIYEENNDYDIDDFNWGFAKSVSIKGLMHHKFCVFDNSYVLTGSWNPTDSGTYKNDNYIIFFNSDLVAKKFNEEFYRVKNQDLVGESDLKINLSGIDIDICFSPGNDCEQKIVDEINYAKSSIDVLAFSFTSFEIAQALVNASIRNVSVRVVFEKTRISSYSQFDYLNQSGVNVYYDGNKYTMHEKMFLIDNFTAILGSYNPTQNANKNNDENLIILKNKELAKDVNEEFERVLVDSLI